MKMKIKGFILSIFLIGIIATSIGCSENTDSQPTNEINPSTISKKEYDNIKVGMTYDEVVKIVGGTGEVYNYLFIKQDRTNGSTFFYYQEPLVYLFTGEGGNGSMAKISYTDNKVTKKEEVGLK